jgi:hypothetical protein
MAAIPSVAVFVTVDAVFVISQQMTDHGRVSIPPMLRLDKNTSADAVGAAVLRCLDEFQEIDGPPEPGHLQELLDFVGARSWTPFAKRAINIEIDGRASRRVTMSPARANGRGAYLYGESHECVREPQAIGEMLLQLAGEHGS